MTPDEQKARAELAKYGDLIDPRYAPDPAKAERELQYRVRQCWRWHQQFPPWICEYVKRWAAEKEVQRVQRGADKTLDVGTGQGLPGGAGTAAV